MLEGLDLAMWEGERLCNILLQRDINSLGYVICVIHLIFDVWY
jgi:hypothetical protein